MSKTTPTKAAPPAKRTQVSEAVQQLIAELREAAAEARHGDLRAATATVAEKLADHIEKS